MVNSPLIRLYFLGGGGGIGGGTLDSHENIDHPIKGSFIFQPLIFRGELLVFQGGREKGPSQKVTQLVARAHFMNQSGKTCSKSFFGASFPDSTTIWEDIP